MTREQAILFLAQVANDLLQTLPKSAKDSFTREAQAAIKKLEEKEPTP